MSLDATTQSKNRDRFLFDLAPGWALGYDNNQWIVMSCRNLRTQCGWKAVSFIGLKKSTLLRVLREKGVEQYPEAQASLDLTPDTFLKWRDQYLTPPS